MKPLRIFHDAPDKYFCTPTLMWLKSADQTIMVQLWRSHKRKEPDVWVLVPTMEGVPNES